MTADRALVALAAGVALAAVGVVLPTPPALGVAGFAVALVALSGLPRSADTFGTARAGAVAGVVGAALLVADLQAGIGSWLGLTGLLMVVTGACAGLRELLPEGTRREAAGRISGMFLTATLMLALFLVLDQAEVAPTWSADVITGLRVLTLALTAWFAAYAVAARTAVPAEAS